MYVCYVLWLYEIALKLDHIEKDNGVPTYKRAPRSKNNVLLYTSTINSLHFEPCGLGTFQFCKRRVQPLFNDFS